MSAWSHIYTIQTEDIFHCSSPFIRSPNPRTGVSCRARCGFTDYRECKDTARQYQSAPRAEAVATSRTTTGYRTCFHSSPSAQNLPPYHDSISGPEKGILYSWFHLKFQNTLHIACKIPPSASTFICSDAAFSAPFWPYHLCVHSAPWIMER